MYKVLFINIRVIVYIAFLSYYSIKCSVLGPPSRFLFLQQEKRTRSSQSHHDSLSFFSLSASSRFRSPRFINEIRTRMAPLDDKQEFLLGKERRSIPRWRFPPYSSSLVFAIHSRKRTLTSRRKKRHKAKKLSDYFRVFYSRTHARSLAARSLTT